MNQNLIAYYINQMTLTDALKLAKQYNVEISQGEATKILDFLKKNRFKVNKENKNALLKEARHLVKESTYQKATVLLDQLLK